MRILIVEDEEAIARGLQFNFEQEGYDVIRTGDGQAALRYFEKENLPIDLVLLDLMLPGMSGYEICKAIRRIDGRVPILVLSARTLSEDKAQAFDCGTDQYVTKPFELPELLSRVRNLLERHGPSESTATLKGEQSTGSYVFDGVNVDFSKFEVTVRGQKHSLTTMEMQLLRYFIEHEGRVLSRSEILEDVWEQSSDVTTRSIDNFVLRLRKLIEPNPTSPCHILSVRGTGYRFIAFPSVAGLPQPKSTQ